MKTRLSLSVMVAAAGALTLAGCETAGTTRSNAVWPDPANTLVMAKEKAAADMITVAKRSSVATSPQDSAWESVPASTVEVQPQQVTQPGLDKASIAALQVQGMTDGRSISWRLTWEDASVDANVDAGRFSDAVAVEFPIDADASSMMGHANGGGRVEILLWKAVWQKDHDVGFQDVEALHPNTWTDLYWFASGKRPYETEVAFADPKAQQYMPAVAAKNPVSNFSRKQPVEQLIAEGFGSATHHESAAATGTGVWAKGHWSVVVTAPVKAEDPADYAFGPEGKIGFAVWQGSAGNAAGRKHWADWVSFKVQQ